jgi:hypothetical protein
VREARSKGEGSDERARGRLQPVTGQPEPDHEHGDRDEDDERLEPDASPDEQPSDVAFADGNVLERRRLGPVEEEDIERVERVEGREEEMARNIEWDEELRKSSGARRVISDAGLERRLLGEGERRRTHRYTQPPGLDVEEDEAEGGDEACPGKEEAKEEPEEARKGREVGKRLCAEEARVGVLGEDRVGIGLLVEEHVGDLGEDRGVLLEVGRVGVRERGWERKRRRPQGRPGGDQGGRRAESASETEGARRRRVVVEGQTAGRPPSRSREPGSAHRCVRR